MPAWGFGSLLVTLEPPWSPSGAGAPPIRAVLVRLGQLGWLLGADLDRPGGSSSGWAVEWTILRLPFWAYHRSAV